MATLRIKKLTYYILNEFVDQTVDVFKLILFDDDKACACYFVQKNTESFTTKPSNSENETTLK